MTGGLGGLREVFNQRRDDTQDVGQLNDPGNDLAFDSVGAAISLRSLCRHIYGAARRVEQSPTAVELAEFQSPCPVHGARGATAVLILILPCRDVVDPQR